MLKVNLNRLYHAKPIFKHLRDLESHLLFKNNFNKKSIKIAKVD